MAGSKGNKPWTDIDLQMWLAQEGKPVEYSEYLKSMLENTEPCELLKYFIEENAEFGGEGDDTPPCREDVALFRNCRQAPKESIIEYLARLTDYGIRCNFRDESAFERNLRLQFISGLHSDKLRQRLLAEPELTFYKAVVTAMELEEAANRYTRRPVQRARKMKIISGVINLCNRYQMARTSGRLAPKVLCVSCRREGLAGAPCRYCQLADGAPNVFYRFKRRRGWGN